MEAFSKLILSKYEPNQYALEVIKILGQLIIAAAVGGIFIYSIEK
jgi:hypothetical protein